MKVRDQIIEIIGQRPELCDIEIARIVGCHSAYVRVVASSIDH